MMPPAPPLQQLGKYQLVRRLATGGMAEVFLAKAAGPMGFEKTVVVKRILPHLASDPQFVEMFLAEARLAADLNHPNVVQIFDFGEAEGSYFIAMEYIDGPNLRTLAERAEQVQSPLPYPVCAKLIAQACEGLAYAHEACDSNTGEPLGLVHRDISPDNLLLARNGSVKVVDFGIAKAAGRGQRTTTGVVKGKLAYMPPEQLQSQPLDKRVDVFALGMVLYEISTGRKPFDVETDVGAMQAILFQSFFPPSYRRRDYPEALGAVVERALAKDRELRYPSCRELQADLEAFLQSTGENVTAFRISQLVGQYVPATVQRTPPPSAVTPGPSPLGSKATPSKPWPTTKNAAPSVQPPGTGLDAALDAAMADANADAKEPDAFARTLVRPEGGTGERAVPRRRGLALFAGVAFAMFAGAGAFMYLGQQGASPGPEVAVAVAEPRSPPPAPAEAPPAAAEPAPVPAPPPPEPAVAAPAEAAPTEPADEPKEGGKRNRKRKGQEARVASTSAGTATVAAPVPPAPDKPAMASFAIDSDPPGQVKVDGKFVGPSPVKVREHAVGEVRVEVSDPKTGFRQEQTFTLVAGDNGIKKIVGRKGQVEFRVFPYARVLVDGKELGQTPIPPAELYEGKHSIRLINADLKKDVTVDYSVAAGSTQMFKYNLSN